MNLLTNAEATAVSAAARKVGGYDQLIRLETERRAFAAMDVEAKLVIDAGTYRYIAKDS